jgi:uncharacterized protein (TIGR03067 family)
MSKATLAIVLAALAFGFAPAPRPRSAKTDGKSELKKLAGTWTIVKRGISGRMRRARPELKVVIAADRWKFTLLDRTIAEYKIALAPGKKPKQMDLAGIGQWVNLKAIYILKGDKLKVCYAPALDGPRPRSFNTRDPREEVLVLERGKPPKGGAR